MEEQAAEGEGMIYDPDELEVGMTVYLFPHTRQASMNVHRGLTVSVMKDPKAHWPKVMVTWKEGNEDKWELVHRDNIKKRAPSARNKQDEKEGDTARGGTTGMGSKWTKVPVMPKQPKANIVLAPDEAQGTLF